MARLQTLEFIEILGPPCRVLGIAVEVLCLDGAVFLELVKPDAHVVEGGQGVAGGEGGPAGMVGVLCARFCEEKKVAGEEVGEGVEGVGGGA